MTTDYTHLGRALVTRHVGALEQAARALEGAPDEAIAARFRAIAFGAVLEEQANLGQPIDVAKAEAIAAEAVTSGERGLRCDFNLIAARLLGVDVGCPPNEGAW